MFFSFIDIIKFELRIFILDSNKLNIYKRNSHYLFIDIDTLTLFFFNIITSLIVLK